MTVKQLITRLLEEPMDAKVNLHYPKEHESHGTTVEGYLFDIDDVVHWAGMCLICFTDWREIEQEEEPQRPINIQAEMRDKLLDELEGYVQQAKSSNSYIQKHIGDKKTR